MPKFKSGQFCRSKILKKINFGSANVEVFGFLTTSNKTDYILGTALFKNIKSQNRLNVLNEAFLGSKTGFFRPQVGSIRLR